MNIYEVKFDLVQGLVSHARGWDGEDSWDAPYLRLRRRFEFAGRGYFIAGRLTQPRDLGELRQWLAAPAPDRLEVLAKKLAGDFILIEFDPRTRSVSVLTDRNGFYRAYFHRSGSELYFSNSIYSMARMVPGAIISSFCLYQVLTIRREYAPFTLLEDVWVFEPGRVYRFTAEGVSQRVYYAQVNFDADYCRTQAECLEALDTGLRRVLERILAGPRVPLLLLSGGIDSALLLKYLVALASGEVRTLTYGLQGGQHEFRESTLAAACLGSRHAETLILPSELVPGSIAVTLDADTFSLGAIFNKILQARLETEAISYTVFSGIDTRLHTPPINRLMEIGLWLNAHFAHPRLAWNLHTGKHWPDYFLRYLLPRANYREYVHRVCLGLPGENADQLPDPYYAQLLALLPEFYRSDDRSTLYKKCMEVKIFKTQNLHDVNLVFSAMDSARISPETPFCDSEFVSVCNRIPFRLGARSLFGFGNGRRFVPFVDKGLVRLLVKGTLPRQSVLRTKAAPDDEHIYFNYPVFQNYIRAILDRHAEMLEQRTQAIVTRRLQALRAWFSGKSSFTMQDVSRLRDVYKISQVCLLQRVAMSPGLDLAAHLEQLHAHARGLAGQSKSTCGVGAPFATGKG